MPTLFRYELPLESEEDFIGENDIWGIPLEGEENFIGENDNFKGIPLWHAFCVLWKTLKNKGYFRYDRVVI